MSRIFFFKKYLHRMRLYAIIIKKAKGPQTMAKKQAKMTTIEILDSFIPIFAACWVLVFAYIALFNESATLAYITVVPIFFIFALYMLGSAVYCYKELEILKAFEKDTTEIEKRHRKKAPKLSKAKLITAGCSFVAGILICILL